MTDTPQAPLAEVRELRAKVAEANARAEKTKSPGHEEEEAQ